MQIISLLAFFCLLITINAQCERINGKCPIECNEVQGTCVTQICSTFQSKLGDNSTNPFKGTIDFIDGTVDLNITITYTDPNFMDKTNQGITEGENIASCLSLNLYKYENTYQFIIPSKDFLKELQLSDDGTIYSFHGYYGLDFNIGNSLQRVLYFDFHAGIDGKSTGSINTTFGSLSSDSSIGCKTECITSITSQIKFCSDETCSQLIEKPDLYLNDQIWLKQILTKQGTENYYLINPEIYFTGDKLFKKATIQQQKIDQKGYAMYLIKVEIAWSPITISVKSSTSSTAGSRILHESSRLLDATQQQAIGFTPEIECVKDKDSNECIECDQSQNVNNQDSPQPDGCPLNGNILIIGFLILVNFLI